MTAEKAMRSRAGRRERHPLLGAFPLSVLTLATFLVVFAILMARLAGGVDPALRASTGASAIGEAGPGGRIVTRTSGGRAVPGAPATGEASTSESAGPVLTRSSGSRGESSEDA